MLKKALALVLGVVMTASLFSACSSDEDKKDDKKTVAVSIVPEQTFVEAVCGDLAHVVTMIPPGCSPENYEPTPQLLSDFSDADIYFSIGVPAESTNIIPSVSENTKVVSLADEVSKKYEERKMGEGRDPHIWLSPKRAVVMVETIRDNMSEIDPDNKDAYAKNAEDFIGQINDADSQIKDALKDVTNRKFVVYHPAFGYFADDYGLEMYALEEEGKEATVESLQEKIDLAKQDNIKVIFYQAEIDSSQSKAFAEEVGGETIQLDPLSADYINNLKGMAKIMADNME